jgi:hypothetical protein
MRIAAIKVFNTPGFPVDKVLVLIQGNLLKKRSNDDSPTLVQSEQSESKCVVDQTTQTWYHIPMMDEGTL